ncbi:MAG: low molecular weight phosphotyrosine protein phosphatase [Gammaproteobacteria bacterium]|nr:low molecular weight phosphotyrosine protein phosphatase [Gammaproteobacteria bacterium]MCW8911533.1 low molecular weight phosphotyrosine protein phosphatase [Gammaproteobacteria bacterium]
MVKVLFVCMGNICRSPTAEGVFRHVVNESGLEKRIHIDSAGTHAYHIGNPPDSRAQAAAHQRNIDLSSQRARKVKTDDFHEFDYIIAMDDSNITDLEYICPEGLKEKLHLFLSFSKETQQHEVPDPYYGGSRGFEDVLDLVEQASAGLLNTIKEKHSL